MAKSIPVLRKRGRGRPPTGQDPVTAVRLSPALKSQIEDWAEQQPDNPSRSEAIRRLIKLALAAKGKQRRP
jgi:Arc/MetJ-type ribon-helix-helix transcriptional regulator